MDELQGGDTSRRLTRRALIRRGAALGGVALWSAPLIRMAVTDREARTMSLAAFPGTCDATLLDDPETVRLICAKNNRGAEAAFEAVVKAECATRCGEGGGCVAPTDVCGVAKGRSGVSVGAVTCTETGDAAGCPDGSYVRGAKEFSCVAVVTCNCECGR